MKFKPRELDCSPTLQTKGRNVVSVRHSRTPAHSAIIKKTKIEAKGKWSKIYIDGYNVLRPYLKYFSRASKEKREKY